MVSRLLGLKANRLNRLFTSSCFQQIQVPATFPSVARASQRVSLGRLLKRRRTSTNILRMASTNVADWDADKYSKDAQFAFRDAAPLLDLLNPQKGERILDLGCGSGELTMVIKEAGSTVVGTDSSPSMVEACKAKGLDARLVDGHDLDFKEEFDAVFSNMALHWMSKDPRQVVKNIYNALKKDGRFVAEFTAEGTCPSFFEHGIPILKRHGVFDTSPWYYPSKEEYADLLKSEGFDVQRISLLPRNMVAKGGPRALFQIFLARLITGDDEKKEQIFKELEEAVEVETDDEGNLIIDAFVMTVAAIK